MTVRTEKGVNEGPNMTNTDVVCGWSMPISVIHEVKWPTAVMTLRRFLLRASFGLLERHSRT